MNKKGQGLIEYALLIAAVLAAFSAMHVYVERASHANIRLIEKKAFAEEEYGDVIMSWVEGFDFWEAVAAKIE